MLDLAAVYRVSNRPSGVTRADVERVERQLGFAFPPGYAEAAIELGYGHLSTTARVHDPDRCVSMTEEVLQRYPGAWLVGWSDGRGGLWYAPRDRVIYEENDLLELHAIGTDYLEALETVLSREVEPPYDFEPF